MSLKEFPYRNSFFLVDIQKGKVLSFLRFLNYVFFFKKNSQPQKPWRTNVHHPLQNTP